AVDQPPWNDARHAFLGKKLKEHLFGDNSHLSDMDAYVFPFPQPLEPMTFLWAPWSLVANRYLSADSHLSPSDRKLAMANISTISANYQPQIIEAIESGPTYQLAENLFCMSEAFRSSSCSRGKTHNMELETERHLLSAIAPRKLRE